MAKLKTRSSSKYLIFGLHVLIFIIDLFSTYYDIFNVDIGQKGFKSKFMFLTVWNIFVVLLFWGLYSIDRELVYPKALDDIIPSWLNHLLKPSLEYSHQLPKEQGTQMNSIQVFFYNILYIEKNHTSQGAALAKLKEGAVTNKITMAESCSSAKTAEEDWLKAF
ncbi:androgen-dependent TFPI-regulating protein-like, partial [Physella acuta]|uniref:androgen-dependent TFPI-regulating protein-like n=1 Tax=Physella acuta TaxID=109671 RepID=UPI0027DBA0AC